MSTQKCAHCGSQEIVEAPSMPAGYWDCTECNRTFYVRPKAKRVKSAPKCTPVVKYTVTLQEAAEMSAVLHTERVAQINASKEQAELERQANAPKLAQIEPMETVEQQEVSTKESEPVMNTDAKQITIAQVKVGDVLRPSHQDFNTPDWGDVRVIKRGSRILPFTILTS